MAQYGTDLNRRNYLIQITGLQVREGSVPIWEMTWLITNEVHHARSGRRARNKVNIKDLKAVSQCSQCARSKFRFCHVVTPCIQTGTSVAGNGGCKEMSIDSITRDSGVLDRMSEANSCQ
jgi:hypothetical protein